ncbi:XRE family transcriptional regulator [Crenobacter sp. SG2305]|uniref:helix-turn-helix domain-containing protein n=1 Tax=Crenobacter oryzisoli TaxID=3056844 RepID=UPI0025AA5A9F|nr:XRE family transcriptional regulator [Crenobacter sp. SG2305]MDN0081289.1 XRE family transcriptional regulator [Crenobacter sp. SG2305]
MTESASLPVILTVSANLRRARQQQGLSQEKLAAAAGVSRRMLVNIEAGESNVSLATLDRLATALGLSFAELVHEAGADPASPVRVWQRCDSHGTLLQSVRQGAQTVELWRWQIGAGERYDADADPAGSHEIVYVVAGELHLELGSEVRQLAAGDSTTFASDRAYAYLNPGSTPLVFTKNVLIPAPGPAA